MSFSTPNVRPYCPGVRVGNWYEDIALEQDVVKDYLDRRERGDLMSQKNELIQHVVNATVDLSVSRDGNIHFGDVLMVVNQSSSDAGRPGSTHALCFTLSEGAAYNPKDNICAETLDVVGSSISVSPSARSAVVIRSCDGSHNGEVLRYNQPFYLSTADGTKFLKSDRATFMIASPKSRHNKVWFDGSADHLAEWQILPFDPQFRMEMKFTPVPANSKIIINHVKTNQNLCLEKHTIHTHFGREREVTCHSEYDSHRAELDTNHWMLSVSVPGSDIRNAPALSEEQ